MKSNVDKLNKRAEQLHRSGSHKEVIEILEELVRLDPQNAANYINNIGSTYLALGDKKNAEKHFRRVLEITPSALNVLSALAYCGVPEHDLLIIAKEILDKHPGHPEANFIFGVYETRVGNLDKALVYYERAIRNFPDNSTQYNNAGTIKAAKGMGLEALVDFKVALLIEPGSVAARQNLDRLLAQESIREALDGRFTLLDALHHEDVAVYGYREAVVRLSSNYMTCHFEGDDRSVLVVDCRYAVALKITAVPNVDIKMRGKHVFGTPTLTEPIEIVYENLYEIFEHDEVKLMRTRNNGKLRVMPANIYVAYRLRDLGLDGIELLDFKERVKQLDLTRGYGDKNMFSTGKSS